MIQANELRIGNWVIYPVIGACKIDSGLHIEDLPTDTQGMPLTPEILEKCGFKKSMDYIIDLGTPDRALQIIITNEGYFPHIVETPETSNEVLQIVSLNKINFVHQLQNLYFALTGQELTINL